MQFADAVDIFAQSLKPDNPEGFSDPVQDILTVHVDHLFRSVGKHRHRILLHALRLLDQFKLKEKLVAPVRISVLDHLPHLRFDRRNFRWEAVDKDIGVILMLDFFTVNLDLLAYLAGDRIDGHSTDILSGVIGLSGILILFLRKDLTDGIFKITFCFRFAGEFNRTETCNALTIESDIPVSEPVGFFIRHRGAFRQTSDLESIGLIMTDGLKAVNALPHLCFRGVGGIWICVFENQVAAFIIFFIVHRNVRIGNNTVLDCISHRVFSGCDGISSVGIHFFLYGVDICPVSRRERDFSDCLLSRRRFIAGNAYRRNIIAVCILWQRGSVYSGYGELIIGGPVRTLDHLPDKGKTGGKLLCVFNIECNGIPGYGFVYLRIIIFGFPDESLFHTVIMPVRKCRKCFGPLIVSI